MSERPWQLYPAGLSLSGRLVVVLGGGHVAQRRLPALLAAGARIHLVSPEVTPAIEGYSVSGNIVWTARGYQPGDLDGAWYVLVATDDRQVNASASAEAEERRIFCVRSDDASSATAWTPAVGRHGPLTIAVLGKRDPARSVAVRDAIMKRVRDGEILAHKDRSRVPGVVLVGAGPGDPDLITVAGRRALEEADVVVADRLASQHLLGELSPEVEIVDATKLPRGRAAAQDAINTLLIQRARAGKAVVRLKGGDPFVFGRGFEELLVCSAAGVPCRVIPGVTSAVSVPGLAGVPVTHRGVAHEFTVVSGHLPPGHPDSLVNWQAIGRSRGTVVLLMAVDNLAGIAATLMAAGRPAETPVAAIQDGSLHEQRRVDAVLGTISRAVADARLQAPAVVVIGDVVSVSRDQSVSEQSTMDTSARRPVIAIA